MSTYTKYSLLSNTSLIGNIYVVSGNTTNYTSFTFYYPGGSYLDVLLADAINVFFVPFNGNLAITDFLNFDLGVLASEYGEGNTNYFNASDVNVPFDIAEYSDGLYRIDIETSGATEIQWVLITKNIDAKMQELATKLLNSQCNCKLDVNTQEMFVKAKAYQELIYNKVTALSTDQATIASIREVLTDVNNNINTLTNFLTGSETLCGC